MESEKLCLCCGKDITGTRGNRKYCSSVCYERGSPEKAAKKRKDHLAHHKKKDILEPWFKAYRGMKSRTNPNSKGKNTAFYRKKGIECRLSLEDVKELWFAHGADKMKHPQCHRMNNDGHYERGNIAFLERWEHHIITKIGRWCRKGEISEGFVEVLRLWIACLRNGLQLVVTPVEEENHQDCISNS